ncbi:MULTISPECIES: hypothetical protein [Achromobacter]|uniref:hypothetical protein n=1 Tax=Achromobacter TaxID=222 RepID=UPI0025C25699|nr:MULTISPECIES: hypothetical protein [Achromobacter]
MTNQNNAAQSAMQETVLTDLEIQEALGAIFVASHPYGRRDVLSQWEWEKAAARAIESALLSKLRATVADERDEPTAPDDDAIAECWVSASDIDGIEYDGPSFERGYRPALTSAPVAGEAVYTLRVRGAIQAWTPTTAAFSIPDGEHQLFLSPAAPPASQAVRILFPTHLRKMWSGGEVQAWLDDHQGVTAPEPSAKGSLDRYRKWQAEQASEAQCSCPSGDGSLRWPCAKHRTHSENDS